MLNLYRLLITFLLVSTIWSCSPQKWCEKHYPSEVSDSTYTKTDTVIKWDTIKVPEISIVFDTLFDFIPKGIVFSHEEKKGSLTSGFSIKNGKIKTLCKADSLELVIKNLQEKTATFHQKKEVKTITEFKDHWYLKPLVWWFAITFLIFVVWCVIKVIKTYTGKP